MNADTFAELQASAGQLAALHERGQAAWDDVTKARDDLVHAIIDSTRPSLPALVTRIDGYEQRAIRLPGGWVILEDGTILCEQPGAAVGALPAPEHLALSLATAIESHLRGNRARRCDEMAYRATAYRMLSALAGAIK